MRPFLRWAGGKRWLVDAETIRLPNPARYVEPFLGGGALFFSQRAPKALLSDINPYLINAYRWMRDAPDDLFALNLQHSLAHSAEHYYRVRTGLSAVGLSGAADFLYLNRSCFNGLFRVNLSGKFNVPIGTKLFKLSDADEFRRWSSKLRSAQILLSDSEVVIDGCADGDLLFVDPPYTVKHNSNGFVEYNEKIFSWDDQVRLAQSLKRAKERGVAFLLTNADHESVRALYPNDCWASERRGSEMAGKNAHRGSTTELIVASSPEMLNSPSLI